MTTPGYGESGWKGYDRESRAINVVFGAGRLTAEGGCATLRPTAAGGCDPSRTD